jgi:tetratricopeptide (TPR) repeat protein
MRRIALVLAIVVAGCTSPEAEIEADLSQRIQSGGLSGAALADAYIDRGLLYLGTNKPDGALVDFNLAIQAAPELAEAYVWRGVVMSVKKDKARARQDFDRALAIDPDYWFARGTSGLAMAEAGDDDAALAELARALELGMPHRGEYFVREVRQQRFTQVNRRGQARTTTGMVGLTVAVDNHLVLYRLTRFDILLRRNEKESALAESREAVRLAPDSFAAQWRLVEALVALDQCEEANRQAEIMGQRTGIHLVTPSPDECPAMPKL